MIRNRVYLRIADLLLVDGGQCQKAIVYYEKTKHRHEAIVELLIRKVPIQIERILA
jgi:hypothetical protein